MSAEGSLAHTSGEKQSKCSSKSFPEQQPAKRAALLQHLQCLNIYICVCDLLGLCPCVHGQHDSKHDFKLFLQLQGRTLLHICSFGGWEVPHWCFIGNQSLFFVLV